MSRCEELPVDCIADIIPVSLGSVLGTRMDVSTATPQSLPGRAEALGGDVSVTHG